MGLNMNVFSPEDERLELEPKITLNCEGKSSAEASSEPCCWVQNVNFPGYGPYGP